MRNAQLFDIDLAGLESLAAQLGATQNQLTGAYNRALLRTAKELHRLSVAMVLDQLAVKSRSHVKHRIKPFVHERNTQKEGRSLSAIQLGSAKIWYGLNPFRVSELRGKMRGQRRVNQPRDPVTGQFQKTRQGARGASFIPKGAGLAAQSYPDSFVAERYGYKSIWLRHERGGISEARVDVAEPVEDAIDDTIFQQIGPIFWKHFEQDLRGRVAGNVHYDPKTRRRA